MANPIELCQTTPVANKKQIKGRFPRTGPHGPVLDRESLLQRPKNSLLYILGNMVLIKRGGCSFMEKSYNAQNHGAVGAIIYNNDENDIDSNIDMVNDESGRQIDIPVLWLVGRNGHMMVDSMLDVSIILTMSSRDSFLL